MSLPKWTPEVVRQIERELTLMAMARQGIEFHESGATEMYEQFTDRARKVMQLANQEAQRFNRDYVGTESILLGLMKEGSGVGGNILKNADITLEKLRMEIEKVKPSGPDQVTMGMLPKTPRAKRVLELAIAYASKIGDNYVGTEHLLMGLAQETECLAAKLLAEFGLSPEQVESEINVLFPDCAPKPEEKPEPEPTSKTWKCEVTYEEVDRFSHEAAIALAVKEKTARRFEIHEGRVVRVTYEDVTERVAD